MKWGSGAQGERWTEDVLRELGDEGWTVEHDLEREYGNDDHLVVGPNGVYLLETKTLRGRVTVENGIGSVLVEWLRAQRPARVELVLR